MSPHVSLHCEQCSRREQRILTSFKPRRSPSTSTGTPSGSVARDPPASLPAPRCSAIAADTAQARLRADLTTAMKARDTLTTGVLRMALAAVGTEEVAGKQARELTDDEVLRVLNREVRKRKEAAEAFGNAGRAEQAAGELAEADVLNTYL